MNCNLPDEFYKLQEEKQTYLLNWCLNLKKIKTFNTNHSSYSLKHIFENSVGGFYITNGAFKGAMIKAGFLYKELPNSVNWIFNVSQKSINSLIN